MTASRSRLWAVAAAAILLALLFIAPFYFVLVNSVKALGEIMVDAASLPDKYLFSNYSKVWDIIKFPKALLNSVLITGISVTGIVIISAMTGYRLVRKPTVFNKILFTAFISAMIIPFQSVMLQLVRVTSFLELRANMFGIVICYLGFGLSLSVFLFHGFIKSVPLEIEEAAVVDGCSPYGVFWRIVFPLLRPIMVTVIILNGLWIWNDYLLPVLIIGSNKDLTTIPLAITRFFGQYTKQWDLALAGLTMGITPIIIMFLMLQKHIIEGISSGSLKG
ncbi:MULTISPECIES: carbohydrate ABC transporter permease [unclassified Paenibacillus]|uniref:carbohydrate ABC transporter permease n=1 Tax=unclassified Paenibacillus TaxID=185978 RepID=UPI001052437A|nr:MULTISPECIES: carbohydrate ABC transporter permease [unclassified Paenibacillus]NIK67316.1 raffinose/stachyose/melibiose transport system permease protein [Paenibacillus sp. BK720]TCN01351.1 carbohydrate ABC transporter membrane protein 2 (CUT1 family) [Paenibacillus sp. BK033]